MGWIDLTVDEAPAIRDFYYRVAVWQWTSVSMGGYGKMCVVEDPAGATVALIQPLAPATS